MTKKLLVSLHDVTPFHAEKISVITEFLQSKIGAGNFAMLVVPDFHGMARIDSDPEFTRKLRQWVDAGCELFLHGYYHLDRCNIDRMQNSFRGRHMTDGEGEFLSIDVQTAMQLLCEGRKMVEDVTGKPVTGFIAPAWLYGDDALEAIQKAGFFLAEDHFRIWNPQGGKVYARGPVISYATRSRLRLLSSLAFSRLAVPILPVQKIARLAIHPNDWHSPLVVKEIDWAIGALARTHIPSRYREIVT